jgi:hypothetical protein
MPPVLPTERIAHHGTADCCIHPPGQNEMIAITPPIIFSKEVTQNRPPHFRTSNLPSPPEIVLRQSLAPNAEITVFPWKDPPELKARTINRARTFLKRHLPA